MLTISIAESLSMGPEAWSQWNMDTNAQLCMKDTAEQCYTPWGPKNLQNFANPISFDIWEPKPDEPVYKPLRPAAPGEPRKLDVKGCNEIMPTTFWASPLRVPLPDPLLDQKPLAEESLVLPPGLTAFARAAPWALASEGPAQVRAAPDATFIQLPPGLEEAAQPEMPAGMSISKPLISGMPCTRVEWCIEDVYSKLQASMGRPVVSPSFGVFGLPNLRLMVFPDGRDIMKNARSAERKVLYANMIKKGPLHGALKLKADCLQCATVMTVHLTVGKIRSGPLRYDFSEQAIHGLDDFGVDWLQQVDKASGSLTVGIELLDVQPKRNC
eukprot:TRINITY_DN51900_c0_g1_i1.p1 TRINITY_DN51900_c0_g1~~TRINITY_DN51900_c0_g1_i1.p1  ORF type:complete len:347 (+),score=81.72 TRINITY_DN51900_c0_g1_i1:63-1043(+)